MTFRALLFGLGQIGCGYDIDLPFQVDKPFSGHATLTHARALTCHPQIQLIAAIDPDPDARERFSRCYKLHAFADLNQWCQAMPNTEVDLVVMSVPPALQPLLVEFLLEKLMPKLLLLEKPVATSVLQAERLRHTLARKPQMKVAVNYIRRYLPVIENINERIRKGGFGNFLHGHLVYGKGLISNGSHFVNLAEALLGPLEPCLCLVKGEIWESFDSEASVILKAVCHHDASLIINSVGSAGLRAGELDLWFSESRLCWENSGKEIVLWPVVPAAPGDTHRRLMIEPERISTAIEHYQHFVVESLVQYLCRRYQAGLKCTFEEGLRTLALLENVRNACD